MTALIDPTRPADPRHRRPDEDPTDVGVPVADGWLDPDTAPLAVYRDRDLPYAPLAVQRDRARVAPAALPGAGPAVAPPSGAAPGPVTPVARLVASASALVGRLGRAR